MSDFALNLTLTQAEKSVKTLTRILDGAKGEERKVIKALLDKLAPGVEAQKKIEQREREQGQVSALVEATTASVLDRIAVMQKRGLRPSTLHYATRVVAAFQEAEKSVEAAVAAKAKAAGKKNSFNTELTLEEMQAAGMNKLARQLTKLGEAFDAARDMPLPVSDKYTLADKRATLAKRCFASALSEGRGAKKWDELDMVAMCFNDMLTHMKLGAAILEGNPRKIDQASSMDTATRDAMHQTVWEFTCNGGVDAVSLAQKPARRPR